MCQFKSGEVVVDEHGVVTVYTSHHTDSHTENRKLNGIKEDTGGPFHRRNTPVEYAPVGAADIFNPETYTLIWDGGKPDWADDSIEAEVRRQMIVAVNKHFKDGRLVHKGALYLRSLTSLPANAKLTAGGYLYLGSLTSLPANAKLTAGGYMYLRSLTSLPANAKLTAGGTLYLGSLTSLPANAKVEAKNTFLKQR